ncbi:hypothetical protein GCM10010472_00320 [Pseudonocardia halophobica]|uniref:Uncharacterized protein n=1 Tax=Pseudonocardia halophobica TaxID=29401 RepID=A0A9W6LAP9_9PSEU|nr:hypothetical protein GCM10017577_60480 [Pseudonocardia halophobica]
MAQLLGLHYPPPLIAALTALLVMQATPASTLVNGVQRVLSAVSGVTLAVLFVSFVGLTWWSLGALVATWIIVGQILRLGPHLVDWTTSNTPCSSTAGSRPRPPRTRPSCMPH